VREVMLTWVFGRSIRWKCDGRQQRRLTIALLSFARHIDPFKAEVFVKVTSGPLIVTSQCMLPKLIESIKLFKSAANV